MYLENHNDGASGTVPGGCTPAATTLNSYNQLNAVSSAQSYFWSVE